MTKVLCIVVLATAFGCHHKDADTTDNGSFHQVADTGDPTDRSGEMIPPEKMDEVQHDLQRKDMIVSHCLATAVEAKEAPKGTKGKIALSIAIASSGAVSNVKVVRSDIKVQAVQDCVVRHVKSIQFPEMGKAYETSYTYAMEAN